MRQRLLLLCLLLLPLGGCLSMPKYVPLDPVEQKDLKQIRAQSSISQDEIIVVARNSNVSAAMGGGLLGALIDSSIAKNRQKGIQDTIEPFYAATDDVDFRKDFWAALLSTLKQSYPVKVTDVKTSPLVLTRAEHEKLLAELPPGDGYSYVGTRYTFTPDYSRLEIYTGIDIWRAGKPEPIYSNLFHYQSKPVPAGIDPMKLWSENNGRLYRETVAEGIGETMKMLKLDMQFPQQPASGTGTATAPTAAKTVTLKKLGLAGPIDVTGNTLDEQTTRVVLRNAADGRLLSLPR